MSFDQAALIKKIPEINLIVDLSLREKVVNVWQEALSRGGWTIDDLDRIPFTLLIKECNISFCEHTRGVTKTALAMAKAISETYHERIKINMDYLTAGAILHDVGKLLEYKKTETGYSKSRSGELLRHPFSGVMLCGKFDMPEEVAHMIATHAKEGDLGRRITEGYIINHADFANFEPFHK
ncbi:MAG TPA: HD domain-containing protein [Candidatus Wallbacteria bacterium]|nr:MAG: HD domain protein [bacterium ADurb.Bin243]HOT75876.1 HD domain-containing protein [Candidatus Wallbacteria bacterium]HPG59297.1 HD domain-containing protein [Candidatus Wallbacteria bacterium]